jgi:hypothetical protein
MDNMNQVTPDELEFIYYKQGTAGGFRTGLYDLYFRADFLNRKKLESTWPELWVVRKYADEPGYWENLQKRFTSRLKIQHANTKEHEV